MSQKSNKDYLHSLLDTLIGRAIQTGETRGMEVHIPYYELADEYKHYKAPPEAELLDLIVTIKVEFGDDDDTYSTGKNFTIADKTRH